jgi:hypothetical protein
VHLFQVNLFYIREDEKFKSIKFSKLALEYSVNNLDRSIIFNNLAKIYFDFNDKESAEQNIRNCYKSFQEESENLKIDFIKSKQQSFKRSKSSLISFLFFNCGVLMNKLGYIQESIGIFKKGYHFSMALLGENNILTTKFRPKISDSISIEKTMRDYFQKPLDLTNKKSLLINEKFSNKITVNFSEYSQNDRDSFLINNPKILNFQEKKNKSFEEEEEIIDKFQNIIIKENCEADNKTSEIETLKNDLTNDKKPLLKIYSSEKNDITQQKLFSPLSIINLKKDESYFNRVKNEFPIVKSSKLRVKNILIDRLNRSEVLDESSEITSQSNMSSFTRTMTYSKDKSMQFNSIELNEKHEEKSQRMNSNFLNEEKEIPGLKELIMKQKEKSPPNNRKSKPKLKDMFGKVFRGNQIKSSSAGVEKLLKFSNMFTKQEQVKTVDKYFRKDRNPPKIKENYFNDRMQILDNDNTKIELISGNSPEMESIVGLETTILIKSTDIKEKLKSEMKNYTFKVQSDSSDVNRYHGDNLYFRNEEIRESPSTLENRRANKRATQIFRFFILNMKKIPIYLDTEKDLIENEVDNSFLENENNYYLSKKIQEVTFSEIFKSLVLNYKENDKEFTTFRKIGEIIFKICLKVGTWENERGTFLCLFKHHNKICEIFITFDKISNFLNKVNIYKLLPIYSDITGINSIDSFLENIFINLCHPIQGSDKNYAIAVLTRPVGVFANKSFEFDFFNCKCTLDFFITTDQNINFFIYSKSKEGLFLQFDVVFDSTSFDSFFKKIREDSQMLLGENEIHITNYSFYNNKHLDRNGVLSQIIFRIQDILKSREKDLIDLESICEKLKTSVMKIQILNDLKDVTFWILSYEANFKWILQYYTLMKIEITNKFYYIHKSHIFGEHDYYNIIGSDPRDSYELLSPREIIITHYLLICSVKLRNINMKSKFLLKKFLRI